MLANTPVHPASLINDSDEVIVGFEGEALEPGYTATYCGLKLRQHLAALAMQGLVASAIDLGYAETADIACSLADALIHRLEMDEPNAQNPDNGDDYPDDAGDTDATGEQSEVYPA